MFGNVASNSIDPETAAFVSSLTATAVTGIYVLGSDASLAVTTRGVFSAAAVGALSTFAGVTVVSTAVGSTIGGT